jgi:hypothetical protein
MGGKPESMRCFKIDPSVSMRDLKIVVQLYCSHCSPDCSFSPALLYER